MKASSSPAEVVERCMIRQRVIYDGDQDCVDVQDENPQLSGGDAPAGVWAEPSEASSASEIEV